MGFLLGLLLGLMHAFEADHVAAIAALSLKAKKIKHSTILGILWGIGHTLALLVIGLLVLLFKYSIPQSAFTLFETVAAIVVITLGASVLMENIRHRAHLHYHEHEGKVHTHLHSHLAGNKHEHAHLGMTEARRSVLIGVLHGLAGSGALLIALIASTDVLNGLAYISLFGIGSITGMAIASTLLGLPFIFANNWQRKLRLGTGIAGVMIGGIMLFSIYFA